ncbi:hypothetical protein VE04_08526 [Pseudogymnoascus sp. 24MN13]|nr:hypothetical protein VE04_08526 [Pseudogymnoascus sp. 24MN13]
MRTCIEPGCNRRLNRRDQKRYPQTLSEPLPPLMQSVSNNEVLRKNMRMRCSGCFDSRYRNNYTTISYGWGVDQYVNSTQELIVHIEEDGSSHRIGVPSTNTAFLREICNTPLFFFDKANAITSADNDDHQWTPPNLYETYSNSNEMKCFLNASDERGIIYDRANSIHQSHVPRDRGASLKSQFTKRERASFYLNQPPEQARFYTSTGMEIQNPETMGLIPPTHHLNVYGQAMELKDSLGLSSMQGYLGQPITMGGHIERLFPVEGDWDPSREEQLRTSYPKNWTEPNPDRFPDVLGIFPPPENYF